MRVAGGQAIAEPHLEHLRHRVGQARVHESGAGHCESQDDEHAVGVAGFPRRLRCPVGPGVRDPATTPREEQCDPRQHRDDARNHECGAPGEVVDHHTDEYRCYGVAGVTEGAVDAEAHALLARRGDDPGDADRVVDGGEQADQGEPREDHVRTVGETGNDGAGADSKKEDHHHADLAPAIAEPASRQGRDTEQHESEAGETQQFAVGKVEYLRQIQDGSGVEHREHVRAGVAEVGERDRGAVSGLLASGGRVHRGVSEASVGA